MDYLDAYDELLDDDPWRERRWQWLHDNGAWCRGCGSPDDEPDWALDLHHLAYEFELGTEPDEHLVSLCARCHDIVHDVIDGNDRRDRWGDTERTIERLQRHTRRSRRLRKLLRQLLPFRD